MKIFSFESVTIFAKKFNQKCLTRTYQTSVSFEASKKTTQDLSKNNYKYLQFSQSPMASGIKLPQLSKYFDLCIFCQICSIFQILYPVSNRSISVNFFQMIFVNSKLYQNTWTWCMKRPQLTESVYRPLSKIMNFSLIRFQSL